jgi:uncharacterized protein YndB with AHSA1/START domain
MTGNKGGGLRILGSLRSDGAAGAVRMEDRFDTDIEKVWAALTDRSRLAHWLGEVDGDLRQGGAFHASFFASGWEGDGYVEVCEPPHHLLVRTADADEPDRTHDHAIELWLAADGNHTNLIWEERGMPVNLLSAYGAGIQIHVEDLAAYLAGRDPRDTGRGAKARWEELHPAYQELAASIS